MCINVRAAALQTHGFSSFLPASLAKKKKNQYLSEPPGPTTPVQRPCLWTLKELEGRCIRGGACPEQIEAG